MSFIPHKARSMFSSPSTPTPPMASASPFSATASTSKSTASTLAPPAPTHAHPSALATMQYQQDLLADFWSGSAAPKPRAPSPPPRSSSSTHSHSMSQSYDGSTGKKKTKWAQAIQERPRARDVAEEREPRTAARTLFLFGFLCPLLWFAGATLLFFPRTPAPAAEMSSVNRSTVLPLHVRAESERERRARAEERWARRCVWACVCVLGAVPVVVLGVVMSRKHA